MLVGEGEVGLLNAVVVQDLDWADPQVQELNHSSYILLRRKVTSKSKCFSRHRYFAQLLTFHLIKFLILQPNDYKTSTN